MKRFCSLIINPVSGGYSAAKLARVLAAFRGGGLEVEILPTGSADDAVSFARRICAERDDPLIMAGGGDGTFNQVLNGVEPGQATLALLPLGTANVLARELGIISLEDAVQRVVRGMTRPMTAGILDSGNIRQRFFLMAGIGLDGAIVTGVRDAEKRLLGKGAYLLAAVRQLTCWDQGLLQVTADGRRYECHTVIVCNAARYGGGFTVAPGADIFSNDFRVVCMACTTRRSYAGLVRAVLAGNIAECRDIRIVSGREILVEGEKAIQVDGDARGRGPARISAYEGFARLIV